MNLLRAHRCEHPQGQRAFASSRRVGLTLVELLIVIGILSLLAAVSLPNIRDIIRDQKFSRTAGVVQSYIAGAQAKAIGAGRPFGVVIERAGNDSAIRRSHSVRLSYAYTPPPYAGDLAGARAIVTNNGNLAFNPADAWMLKAAAVQFLNGINDPVMGPGDSVGIGLVPRYFLIQSLNSLAASGESIGTTPPSNATEWPLIVLTGPAQAEVMQQYPVGTSLPFRIIRQPTPSLTAPLELPEGMAIDLVFSGIGLSGDDFSPLAIDNRRFQSDGSTPVTNRYGSASYAPAGTPTFSPTELADYRSVTIMFDGTGAVSQVIFATPNNEPDVTCRLGNSVPGSNIFLLLGKLDGIYPDAPFFVDDDSQSNLTDFESSWIVINRQTGEVAVSPLSSFGVDGSGAIVNPVTGLVSAAPGATLQTKIQAAAALSRREAAAYTAVNR